MLSTRLGSVVTTAWLALGPFGAGAPAEPPAVPQAHFNDYAGFVGREVALRLDSRLRECERETGAQIVVAVFAKLPEPSMEAFTLRTAKAWSVGRQGHDDGVVFFVFVQDRKHRIEVGRGLRQKLPDRLARQILDELVAPQFRAGRPDAGLDAGVEALIGAVGGRRRSMLDRSTVAAAASAASEGSSWFWALLGLGAPAVIAAVTLVLLRSRTPAAVASPGGGATLGPAGTWDSRDFATLRAAANPPRPKRSGVAHALGGIDVADTFETLSNYGKEPETTAYTSDSSSFGGDSSSSFSSGGGSFDGGGSSGSW